MQVKTGRAALFGIPRNMVGVPLPPESAGAVPGGHFPGLLNALYVYAMGHPTKFPGGDARGMRAVSGAVQELLGVRLDGMVVVNLGGFVTLVDELGGLWIDVPERLVDKKYPLEDGCGLHRARRSRPAASTSTGGWPSRTRGPATRTPTTGECVASSSCSSPCAASSIPVTARAEGAGAPPVARDNLWTTIRRQDLRGLAQLAGRVDVRRVARVLFAPSRYPAHLDTAEIGQIRRVARTIFDGRRHLPAPTARPSPPGTVR